jgi:hypothetical protein
MRAQRTARGNVTLARISSAWMKGVIVFIKDAPGMKELYSSGEVRAIPGEDGGAVEYRSEEGVSSPMS